MQPENFAAYKVEQIDRHLTEVRNQIESLMQSEEFLVEERAKWLGRIATQPVQLTLIHGGKIDREIV